MINFSDKIISTDSNVFPVTSRGMCYGDMLYETLRVVNSKILFLEDHYLRLMASMRIARMDIPMCFTISFFEEQLLKTIKANDLQNKTLELRFTVFRTKGDLILPKSHKIEYVVFCKKSNSMENYQLSKKKYEVDIYKDYEISTTLLSTLKQTNQLWRVLGSIYADDNELENCLLLNTRKHLLGVLDGNIFIVQGNTLITPPISEGAINGILRKNLIRILKNSKEFEIKELPITSFMINEIDELFITNVRKGIVPITKYRRKTYKTNTSIILLMLLNDFVRKRFLE